MSAAVQGRGSAMLLLMVSFVYLLIQYADPVHGANYTVGDAAGWRFDTVNWPQGKTFKAGDVLVFNYRAGFHNVVVVNESGYNSCSSTPADARVYESGNDNIQLVKGQNFFICSFFGHCEAGMKIAVNAV